jgi:protein NDRG1
MADVIFFDDDVPEYDDSNHSSDMLQVERCGSLATEERPQSMIVPIELFLTGYAFYQPPLRSLTSSPLSPLCMAAELLSPESLGLKLKPIKTRVASPEP